MIEVGVHEAKKTLSRPLRLVAAGEEVVIKRGNEPVARLVPIGTPTRRVLGQDAGLFEVPPDFDDDLPDEVLARFGG